MLFFLFVPSVCIEWLFQIMSIAVCIRDFKVLSEWIEIVKSISLVLIMRKPLIMQIVKMMVLCDD